MTPIDPAGLRAEVRACVAPLVAVPLEARQDDALLADLAPERYDSLGVLDCVGAVEQRFGIDIDLVEDDLRSTFRSVASITDLVARKLRDAAVLG